MTMNLNRRQQTIILASLIAVILAAIALAGLLMPLDMYGPHYEAKHLPPSAEHFFGTDYLGRDMAARTIKGLSTSILIGLLAAAVSTALALFLGVTAAMAGGILDTAVSFLVDLFMGIPHLVLLMLISFMLGKGVHGVILAVALTHWPSLTRVIRAETLALRNAQFVLVSRKLGKSAWETASSHIVPHVLPQFIIGLILLFPHAILHEASITFLGFGLPLDTPAIGIILSESMKHIPQGMWWLVLFPGILLVTVVMLFDKLGSEVRFLLDPSRAQE